MNKTEFDYLMIADTKLNALEAKGYKVFQDKFGGVMVKGPGVAVYSHKDEYEGANEGERIWRQVEAIYGSLNEKLY